MKTPIYVAVALISTVVALTLLSVATTAADPPAAQSGTTPLKDFLPGTIWVPVVASRGNWESIKFTTDGNIVRTLRGGKVEPGRTYEIGKDDKEVVVRWSNGSVAWTLTVAANHKTLEYDKVKYKPSEKQSTN